MIRIFITLLFLCKLLLASSFTVASYNIENLFDLNYDKSDYKEYRPNTNSNWNKKTFETKIKNSIRVLKDLNTDIIALQEIENLQVLKLLQKKLPEYKYISFSKYSNSSVGVGFLSKLKIIDENSLNIKFSNKIFRPILETTFEFENIQFKIFNNHWPSKRVAESYRIKYAKKLFDRLLLIAKDYDYILLGDFNSNYNEFETIYHEKRLNNTNGITGINHVLNSYINDSFVTKEDILNIKEISFFNPWLELNINERFSSKFRGRNVTPDNILLPFSMFDSKKISYVQNSFKVFKPDYLYKNGKIIRWQMKNKVHLAKGYSDHLPIIASFTDEKQSLTKSSFKTTNSIKDLYKIQKLNQSIVLKNAIVLLKAQNFAIIKQKNDKAILVYSKNNDLTEGFAYDLQINSIKTYKGLKEIVDFRILNYNGKNKDYKKLYYKANEIDVFNLENQNEIIKDIKGIYKNRYLYFDENSNKKKVAIYFKNKKDIPKNDSKLIIKRAQISYYLDKVQLTVFNKSDIKYVD